MLDLLRPFIDIVLWRKGPQHLPQSNFLLALTAGAYVAVSAVQLLLLPERSPGLVLHLFVDPLLLAGWIWLVLVLFGRQARFVQTLTAIFGVYAVLSVVALLLQFLRTVLGLPDAALSFAVLAWLVLFVAVTGRCVMLALERGLATGIAVMITYVVASTALSALLAPGSS